MQAAPRSEPCIWLPHLSRTLALCAGMWPQRTPCIPHSWPSSQSARATAPAPADADEDLILDDTQRALAKNTKCPITGRAVRAAAPVLSQRRRRAAAAQAGIAGNVGPQLVHASQQGVLLGPHGQEALDLMHCGCCTHHQNEGALARSCMHDCMQLLVLCHCCAAQACCS